MAQTEIRLGKVQLHIMQFLWNRGEATARDITQHLESEHALARSTIQTLLRKLEKKGAIDHVERDRVFYFRPQVEQGAVTADTTHDFLTRVFQGSVAGMVAHILEHEHISREELDQLKEMIEARREKCE